MAQTPTDTTTTTTTSTPKPTIVTVNPTPQLNQNMGLLSVQVGSSASSNTLNIYNNAPSQQTSAPGQQQSSTAKVNLSDSDYSLTNDFSRNLTTMTLIIIFGIISLLLLSCFFYWQKNRGVERKVMKLQFDENGELRDDMTKEQIEKMHKGDLTQEQKRMQEELGAKNKNKKSQKKGKKGLDSYSESKENNEEYEHENIEDTSPKSEIERQILDYKNYLIEQRKENEHNEQIQKELDAKKEKKMMKKQMKKEQKHNHNDMTSKSSDDHNNNNMQEQLYPSSMAENAWSESPGTGKSYLSNNEKIDINLDHDHDHHAKDYNDDSTDYFGGDSSKHGHGKKKPKNKRGSKRQW